MTNFLYKRYLLPALGIAGILYALYYVVVEANTPPAPPQQLNLPPSSPYPDTISGTGLIEANTRNIGVGSSLSGIVAQVAVTEGDEVQAGTPLFQLDDRSAKADVETATAQAEEARANLADQQDQLKRAESMKEGVSVTVDHIERLKFAVQEAKARFDVATAQLDAAHATLDKLTVMAPVDGRILKVNIRKGEFVPAEAGGNAAPIIMGNDKPLYVSASIDENDVWRLKPNAAAEGFLRGNRDIHFPLKFVRIEPYVVPKTSLTGATSERVDTRVLELLYSVEVADQPLYIGQQVDVFISAAKASERVK